MTQEEKIPKEAEWSEEDEIYFPIVLDALDCFINGRVCSSMASHDVTEQACDWFKNRIKSLRPSWKPSEEQIEVLETAKRWYSDNMGCNPILELLYEQLKSYSYDTGR